MKYSGYTVILGVWALPYMTVLYTKYMYIHVHVHCTYYGYASLRSLRKVGVRYLDCP